MWTYEELCFLQVLKMGGKFHIQKKENHLAIVTAYFPFHNPNPQPHTYNFHLYYQLQNKTELTSPTDIQRKFWKDFGTYIS